MSRHRTIVCATLMFMSGIVVLAGCEQQKSTSDPKAAAQAAVAAEAKPDAQSEDAAQPADIKLTVVDKEGYKRAIAAHKGKVVLVDFWATWCPPCVKQFPHTVELWRKNRDRGLDVIALSFDEPDEQAGVLKFLSEKGANFENLISKVGAAETSADEFEFDGALPHYVIYDREGNLFKRISPSDPTVPFRPDLIDEAVEEQLAKPAAP